MNNLLVFLLQIFYPRNRRAWYRKWYLRSKHWKKVSREKKQDHGYWCDKCHRAPIRGTIQYWHMDAHHITYQRLWRERLDDLQVLCRPCHKLEHV